VAGLRLIRQQTCANWRSGVSERRIVKRLWGNSDSLGILYSDYTVYPDMDPGLAGSKKTVHIPIFVPYMFT
jgi:hypothetical protein